MTLSGAFTNCGGFSPLSNSSVSGSQLPQGPADPAGSAGSANLTTALNLGSTAPNVIPVGVGNCGANGYLNEPCVSIQICLHGTTQCQTIPNILLDTGSYGLRIFSSLVTLNLPQEKDGAGNAIAQCAQFGSANLWGPIQSADIILGGEPAVNLPLQLINSSFADLASHPSDCATPDTDPASSGFNGILGVGLLTYDCGLDCVTYAANQTYYSCNSANVCTNVVMPLNQQVANPVAFLPIDNNGVILSLPLVDATGASSINGTLTLGIGTQSNNIPGSVKVFSANSFAEFSTTYNNQSMTQSFIDSGSNGLFFPDKTIPDCTKSNIASSDFFCPPSSLPLTATQVSADGLATLLTNFSIGNAATEFGLYPTNMGVFNSVGGSGSDSAFDWGLPFFLGRSVFCGFESTSSAIGKGPYWAY